MLKRFLMTGCLVLSGASFPDFSSANEALEVSSMGQVVKFHVTIPEVRPLQLDTKSVRLSRRDIAEAGDADATTRVVADQHGRHHLRQTRQQDGRLHLTLATP